MSYDDEPQISHHSDRLPALLAPNLAILHTHRHWIFEGFDCKLKA